MSRPIDRRRSAWRAWHLYGLAVLACLPLLDVTFSGPLVYAVIRDWLPFGSLTAIEPAEAAFASTPLAELYGSYLEWWIDPANRHEGEAP